MNAPDLFRLGGSAAIVTGGGRGLGSYMAEVLSDANVALCSRKRELLDEVRQEIAARGGREITLAETEEAFGSVDVSSTTPGQRGGLRRRRCRWTALIRSCAGRSR